MATIKEMADKYARAYLFSPQGGKGPDDHYVEGANAVLNEIEKIVESSDFIAFPRVTHEELSNKIKQLKGELSK